MNNDNSNKKKLLSTANWVIITNHLEKGYFKITKPVGYRTALQ